MSIPFTVLGGFLGAGKTTLLNRILRSEQQRRYAVLVNDFGDLAIDGDLIAAHDGDTITFANGCVCCSIGDDFVGALMRLLQRDQLPEHILIEASGVSDPRAIAEFALLHPQLHRDLVVVLVDAASIRARAEDPCLADTVTKQLQAADLLVLNKCDQVSAAERQAVQRWLQQQRPEVAQLSCSQAEVPVALLFGSHDEAELSVLREPPSAHSHGHAHAHPFSSLTLRCDKPLALDALQRTLAALPASVLRVKGFVRSVLDPRRSYLVQLSGRHVDISEQPAPAENAQDSRLVVIGTREMPSPAWLSQQLGF